MADKVIVTKSKLITLADTIRDNTETSRSLTIDNINKGITNMAIKFSDLIKRNSIAIFVPVSVDTVGEYSFAGCTKLATIDFSSHTTIPILANVNAFSSVSSGCQAIIPNDLYDEWIAADVWKDVTTLTYIKAFSEGLAFTQVDSTYTVSGIGTCTDTNVKIPSTYNGLPVTSIGPYAFRGCNLTSITIPDSVTSIEDHAFDECSNLTSITIPDGVTSIKDWVFGWCSRLTNITITDNITSIGSSAFYCCSSLASIIIPENVTSIGNSAFYGCRNLVSIIIPKNVTRIGYSTFRDCRRLSSINFSSHTAIPTLVSVTAFDIIASGCQAILPDALYDEWIAANVWKDVTTLTYVKKSEATI